METDVDSGSGAAMWRLEGVQLNFSEMDSLMVFECIIQVCRPVSQKI